LPVVVAGRLLDPINIFLVQRPAAFDGVVDGKALVEIDGQDYVGADGVPNGAKDGQVFVQRFAPQPDLDDAIAAFGQKFLGLLGGGFCFDDAEPA